MSQPAPAAAGVLLAAGAGTRFGMPKVLAERGAWLRAAVVDVPAPARAVIARDWRRGPGASLRAALAALPAAEFAVVLTVDTPDIGANVVARVLGAARRAPSGIARATYDGRPGHPVVIARGHWAALTDDEGARGFLAGRADVAAVDCADLATGADIDTR